MENTGRPKSKSAVRKGKKDWKKNIDITDVENDLEEIRKEEIAFGGKIEDQANEELFTIDVEGDSEVKRKNKSKKLLTIEEILKPQSKVKAFGSSHNKDSKNVSRFNLSKYTKEQVEKINKRKAEEKIKKANKKKKTSSIITKDLWEEADNTEQQEYNFFNQPKPKAPSTLKYNKIAEKVEAVQVGHPGTSYNPTFDDHQDALRIANDIEQKKEDEKAKIEKELSYPPELDEMSDHEVIDDDDDEEEEEDTVEDQKAIKITERKTRAQRNKEKKLKEKEEKRLEKLREKEMGKQIEEIENIQKIIDEKEKNTIEKMNKPKKEKMPRLGKVRYQAKSMDIQLTEELSESLRGLKPEGNLFTDRFKSLQERAIIEPRVRNTRERRYKLKEYEKHSYKKF
ncbi:P60-like protein, partial [Piromyces finnis]